MVCQHNKLRAALTKNAFARDKSNAEKKFRADPHKFAAKLFNKDHQHGKPAFSAETAQQYFEKTYRDEKRDYVYAPLPDFQCPPIPSQVFSLRCPTANELNKSINKKRNGAAPGLNALAYVPYKKCAAIMKFVVKFRHKIWKF